MTTIWRPVSTEECLRQTKPWWNRTTSTTTVDEAGNTTVTWTYTLQESGTVVPVYRVRSVGDAVEPICEISAILFPLEGSST